MDPVQDTATAIAHAVRTGQRTAVDVTREYLARIESLDPQLNAFAWTRPEDALADAAAVDADPARGDRPLAGVPVAIKDNMALAGHPVRHGSAATSEAPAAADDELVARVRAAGAVVLGSTRLPEFAAWAFTASHAYGITRNPLDPSLDPGGSSGGSAAAVASGMAALALATDGGGSIRVPSASCGLVGLKPTRGAVPLPGGVAEHWYGLSVAGAIAQDVEDAALAFAVLTGGTAQPLEQPTGLRIAVSLRSPSPLGPPDAHHRRAVETAQSRLSEHGHTVMKSNPKYPPSMLNDWGRSWLAGIAEEVHTLGLDLSRLEPRTQVMVRKGRKGPGNAASWTARAEAFFVDHDVLVTPAIARGPLAAGALKDKGYLGTYLASARTVPFSQAWNLAGFPAIVLPVGTVDGRPLPVQLVARPGGEQLLLGLAAQIAA